VTENTDSPSVPAEGQPCRSLKDRHLQLMGMGCAIGAGFLLGSGSAIHEAGPGLLLAYLLAGTFTYLIIRALGELALAHPSAGSFSTYAEKFLGPLAGFVTGWSYWFGAQLAGIAEITARKLPHAGRSLHKLARPSGNWIRRSLKERRCALSYSSLAQHVWWWLPLPISEKHFICFLECIGTPIIALVITSISGALFLVSRCFP
jgi:amino acid transporter